MKRKLVLFCTALIVMAGHVNAQNQKSKSVVNKAAKKRTATVNNGQPQQVPIKSTPTAQVTSAKEENGIRFTYGVVGGVQNNYLLIHQKDGDLEATIPFMGLGYHFGGVIHAKFNPHFGIQAQVNAVSKATSFSNKNEFKLFAIDVPLNFLYHHQAFYIGGGPTFSYGIKAEHIDRTDELHKYDLYSDGGEPSPILNKWNRLEIGAGLKMGYEFETGLSVSAVYNRGFSKMYKKPAAEVIPINRINTSALAFAIGYTFGK